MCLNARDDLSDGLGVITFQVLTLRLGPRGDSNRACQFSALLSADHSLCAISFRPAVSTLMA
jgi:hypothetical protein